MKHEDVPAYIAEYKRLKNAYGDASIYSSLWKSTTLENIGVQPTASSTRFRSITVFRRYTLFLLS